MKMNSEKDIQSISEKLYMRLTLLREDKTIVDPNPDWYNPHDYSSGRFMGWQLAVKNEIEFLETLLDKIERS